jgi:small subunit ribosomal protein S17
MQKFKGTIVTLSSKDTVKVAISYSIRHPKYLKVMKKTTNLLVHNEMEGLKVGDKVEIVKSMPFSKRKHFIVVKKV